MAQLNSSPRKGKGKRHAIHMDMTPMVDLAFLLLTFFILTVTLNHAYILKIEKTVDEDNAPAPPVKAERVITVILGAKDKVYWYHGVQDPLLERTDFKENGIRKVLLEKNKQIPNMVLLVKPSAASRYKNLVDILDEIENAKIEHYYIVKETPLDRELVLAMNN